MAIYAVGDVQGCARSLMALLDLIPWDPKADEIWLVGDLVNRGSGSLEVLRWAREAGQSVRAVLGNHDLHLLAVAAGRRSLRPADTLAELLQAPDAAELLSWLRQRPLLHEAADHLMVHAGFFPVWDLATARALAREIEAELREGDEVLGAVGSRSAPAWSPQLRGDERRATILEGFTRVRLVDTEGHSSASFKGAPADAPPGTMPWFDHPRAAWRGGPTLVVGHWAALGLHLRPHVMALDSGCVWGARLSAVRLDDRAVFSVAADARDLPTRAS